MPHSSTLNEGGKRFVDALGKDRNDPGAVGATGRVVFRGARAREKKRHQGQIVGLSQIRKDEMER